MKKILVTGGAGFIGSNIIGRLLKDDYQVRCYDNLSTGSISNIDGYLKSEKFEFINADITDYSSLLKAVDGIDYILHQAALGSVPRSIKDPLTSSKVNIEGTLNVFNAAVEKRVRKVVYAASSSTYGDSVALPKVETVIGKPLSPYAVTKLANELYADVFSKVYGLRIIGLRYFNVFGPRQNPDGAYAAVIPRFINSILKNESAIINGDGSQSRDFTYVDNVVMANIQAMLSADDLDNEVFNVACNQRISLNELWEELNTISGKHLKANYGPDRPGDVKHSLADISKAKKMLNYEPHILPKEGLLKTYLWFKETYDLV